MARLLTGSLLLGASACATTAALHDRDRLDPRQAYMCMAADGQWIGEETVADPATGAGRTTCPAPARYVALPVCAARQERPDETPELWRERLRDARDHSLHGDDFLGRAYCSPVLRGPPMPPPPPDRPRAVHGRPYEPALPGFDAASVRAEVERHVGERLGAEALRQARAAATSVMVTHHAGLPPPPVRRADGSWDYGGPGANAMVRGGAGWTGWAGTAPRPVAAARAAEIDRILADPAFWAEPDYIRPTCTDAGARRLVVRHAGRTLVRQQSCGGVGLTGRLWELVFGGPG